jgi:hypothetical protein
VENETNMARNKLLIGIGVVIVVIALSVGAYMVVSARNASPVSLTGMYNNDGANRVDILVTEEHGGYYLYINHPGHLGQPEAAVPMSSEDQEEIGGNAADLTLVGLKSTTSGCMVFRMSPGRIRWNTTFATGYGCFRGTYGQALTPLQKIR